MTDNAWRQEITATDYFGGQQRRLQIADRRPLIRQGFDLVGPGIGMNAVDVVDWNNSLAQVNGFFSSTNATNSPSSGEFVGYVVSDAALGGWQRVIRLADGVEFTRHFTRSPWDAETLQWGSWDRVAVVPTGVVSLFAAATAPSGWLECDGSDVSRATYADLFTVIGTTFGPGDGATTFTLPTRTDVDGVYVIKT